MGYFYYFTMESRGWPPGLWSVNAGSAVKNLYFLCWLQQGTYMFITGISRVAAIGNQYWPYKLYDTILLCLNQYGQYRYPTARTLMETPYMIPYDTMWFKRYKDMS